MDTIRINIIPFPMGPWQTSTAYYTQNTFLPKLLTNEGETYFTAFCTCISKFVDDKINYAFSLAFTTSPDGIPQPHVIPNDDDDEMDEVKWHTPAHVRQNEQSNKRVRFSKSTKPPKLFA
jgi:hypothetical protein